MDSEYRSKARACAPPLYQLFHLNRGLTTKITRLRCTLCENYKLRTEISRTWIHDGKRGDKGDGANMAGCDSPALFRSAFSLSRKPAVPEPARCVFVTTKLREKFVARIPATGARSHARGEKKREGGREGERSDAAKTGDKPRRNTNVSFGLSNYELIGIIARVVT
jgi:hypothetical protein